MEENSGELEKEKRGKELECRIPDSTFQRVLGDELVQLRCHHIPAERMVCAGCEVVNRSFSWPENIKHHMTLHSLMTPLMSWVVNKVLG